MIWKYRQIHLTTLTVVPGPKSLTCVCGVVGFLASTGNILDTSQVFSQFSSDTVYPEILSDFTGWGSSPLRLAPQRSSGPCYEPRLLPVFLTKDYKWEVPMTCPRLLKMPVTSLRLFRVLLTNWLQIRGSHNPLLWFDSLARAAQKTQGTRSFTRWLVNHEMV